MLAGTVLSATVLGACNNRGVNDNDDRNPTRVNNPANDNRNLDNDLDRNNLNNNNLNDRDNNLNNNNTLITVITISITTTP